MIVIVHHNRRIDSWQNGLADFLFSNSMLLLKSLKGGQLDKCQRVLEGETVIWADLCSFSIIQKQFLFPNIQMGPPFPPVTLLLVVLTLGSAMHIGHPSSLHFTTDSQLATLQKQQSAFETSINNLITDIQQVQKKVNGTTDTNEKVILLENAVTSQRKKIHDLETQIVPSFNLSKNSCKQLTSEQKVALIAQLAKAKSELTKLKDMAAKVPANAMVTQIQDDIAKQQTILTGIDNVIHSNCSTSAVLTPTIFQSNLYATNWILGRQSINNIVDQYYQRSRQYHNVTNCPLVSPYFDGKKCVKCEGSTPLFNMETAKCSNCPEDTLHNQTMHTCEQIQHNSNFNNSQNYGLDGAKELPKADPNLTACPSTKPYFSGRCLACDLPSYWSVKDSKCKECPHGEVFDINNKRCQKPENDTLTYLHGDSKWVTSEGNLTKVLEERAKIKANTTIKFNTCGKSAPYFDGVQCITCPKEFDLNTKKCCEAPSGKVYNPNLHAYVTPKTDAATNPEAPNLLNTKVAASATTNTTTNTTNGTTNTTVNGTTSGTTSPTTNGTSTNTPTKVAVPANACPLETPYYDGIACIKCPSPFPLFNNQTKKCVQCDSYYFFNSTTKICQKRPLLYISSNFTNIIATPKVSLSAYKTQLYNKVNNSGNAIVVKCKADEYSDYTKCFKCPEGEKFNLEQKICAKCNGTVDSTTFLCHPLSTKLSNLDANNTIWGDNKTKADYEKGQKEVTGPIEKCPNDKPYAVKGLKCIACNSTHPYFDLSKQECVGCPKDLYYDSVAHKCDKEINITNADALLSFIETDNYTRANIKTKLEELSKTRKTKLCPAATPVASKDGSSCSQCTKDEFVDLRTMQCQKGKSVSNIDALNKTGKVLELGNFTLAKLDASIKATINAGTPTVNCPTDKPLFNGTACISCPLDEYYNLQELNCYKPKLVSNVNALAASKRYAEVDANTLDNLNKNINSSQLPTTKCPKDKPMFDGQHCQYCPNQTYYNLGNNTCYTPQKVTNTQALEKDHNYIESGRHTLLNIAEQSKASPMPTASCPADKPLYNGTECIGCPKGEYYYLKTSQCVKEKQVSNVDGLNKTGKVIERGEYTLVNLKAKIAASKIPTKPCPAETPLFNGTVCRSCPKDEYYSLQMTKCYKPIHHTNITAVNETHRVLERDNHTLQQLKDRITKDNLPTKDCPTATPMLSAGTCISCPQPKYYDIKSRSCYKPKYRTNIQALQKDHRYIEIDNHTLKALNESIQKETLPTRPCPSSAPIYDGTSCHHCHEGEFYLLSNLTCIKAKNATNVEALNKSKLYIEDGTHTLQAIQESIKKDPYPSGPCPDATPVLKDNACFGCPQGEYVVLSNFTCYKPEYATNVTALSQTRNYVEDQEHTLKKLNESIRASKLPTKPCPQDKPVEKNKTCFVCPTGEFILLSNMSCYKAESVTNVEALKTAKNYIEDGNVTLAKINESIVARKLPVHVCHSNEPVAKNGKCFSCPQGQYYLLSNATCYVPLSVTNVDALKTAKNYVQNDNHTLSQLNDSITASKLPTKACPSDKPVLQPKNNTCVAVPQGKYVLLSNMTIYTPKKVANVEALKKNQSYVEDDNHTLAKLNSSIAAEKLPTEKCPEDKPVFGGENKTCFTCPKGEYILLSNFTCYTPKLVTNVDALKTAKNYVQNDNHTLSQLNDSIKAEKLPTKACPSDKPVLQPKNNTCIAVPEGKYVLLSNMTIYTPKEVANVDALKTAKNYVENDNHTLSQLNTSIASEKLPTKSCPADKPILQNGTCSSCPKGEYVLLSNMTCYKPKNRTNVSFLQTSQLYIQIGNYTLANLNASINANVYPTVPCPQEKPVLKNEVCSSCPKDEFYFLSNFSCYKAQQFSNTNTLSKLKNVVQRGNGTVEHILAEIKNQTNPVAICHETEPMFNDTSCIKCSDKEYYVLDKKKCEPAVYITNTDSITLSGNYVETSKVNMTSLIDQNKNVPQPKVACPTETPLFNGTACVSCKTSLYELEQKKCITCISTHYFDSKSHSCKEKPNYYPNLTNKLWVVSTDKGKDNLQALVNERKALKNPLECPIDKPHFNNDTQNCLKCADKEYFDYDTKKCQACGTGEEVDYNTRKCAKRLVGVYQTNLNTHNLLFEGKPKAQFQEEYDNNKKNYPSIQDCPTDKPYFDGFACITCPAGNSLFSLDSKLCTSCPEGSSYTPSEKQCTSSSGALKHSDPSMSKMYSSIF